MNGSHRITAFSETLEARSCHYVEGQGLFMIDKA
jgi:hypothetical protein